MINFTRLCYTALTKNVQANPNDASECCDTVEIPRIENAQKTLQDIYNQTSYTLTKQWIHAHAELKQKP